MTLMKNPRSPHQHQRRTGKTTADRVAELDHQRPEHGHDEIHAGSGGSDPQHVFLRAAQVAEVDGYRFGPAEQDGPAAQQLAGQQNHQRHQDGAHRVDVLDRIKRDTPLQSRRHVAEEACDVAVSGFMQGDGKNHRQREHGYFLDQGEFHVRSRNPKYRPCRSAGWQGYRW